MSTIKRVLISLVIPVAFVIFVIMTAWLICGDIIPIESGLVALVIGSILAVVVSVHMKPNETSSQPKQVW